MIRGDDFESAFKTPLTWFHVRTIIFLVMFAVFAIGFILGVVVS